MDISLRLDKCMHNLSSQSCSSNQVSLWWCFNLKILLSSTWDNQHTLCLILEMVNHQQSSSSLIHMLTQRKKPQRRKRKKIRQKLWIKWRNTRRRRRWKIRRTRATYPRGNLTGHPSSQIWGLMRAILIKMVQIRWSFMKISMWILKLHPSKRFITPNRNKCVLTKWRSATIFWWTIKCRGLGRRSKNTYNKLTLLLISKSCNPKRSQNFRKKCSSLPLRDPTSDSW